MRKPSPADNGAGPRDTPFAHIANSVAAQKSACSRAFAVGSGDAFGTSRRSNLKGVLRRSPAYLHLVYSFFTHRNIAPLSISSRIAIGTQSNAPGTGFAAHCNRI
jgi:hypothetical protein